MTREREYRNIYDKLACVSCPDNKLRDIKEYFVREIDSARRFDNTNSIINLLRILEKRDSLSTEHIDPLRYIARALNRNDIIALIDAYEVAPQILSNEFQVPSNEFPALSNDLPDSNRSEFRVIPPIHTDPIERVDNLICTEIGQKWKDLARALKVPEGRIDELEWTYRRISDMVREVLRFHRENSDVRYWKINLCNGLSTARRRDLDLAVQNIFARHNLM